MLARRKLPVGVESSKVALSSVTLPKLSFASVSGLLRVMLLTLASSSLESKGLGR